MAQEMVSVQIGEKVYQYEKGTTYREIALAHQQDYENDIVLVFVNKKLQELRKTLKTDCEMQFVTTGDQIGYATYKRSMNPVSYTHLSVIIGTSLFKKLTLLKATSAVLIGSVVYKACVAIALRNFEPQAMNCLLYTSRCV